MPTLVEGTLTQRREAEQSEPRSANLLQAQMVAGAIAENKFISGVGDKNGGESNLKSAGAGPGPRL